MAGHGELAREGKEGEERGRGRGLLAVGRREAPWGELHQDGGSVPAVHVLSVLLEFLHEEEEETGKRVKKGEKKEKKCGNFSKLENFCEQN
jgi:hypothetical protein